MNDHEIWLVERIASLEKDVAKFRDDTNRIYQIFVTMIMESTAWKCNNEPRKG